MSADLDEDYGFTVLMQGVVACLLRGETDKARGALAGISDEQRARASQTVAALTRILQERP